MGYVIGLVSAIRLVGNRGSFDTGLHPKCFVKELEIIIYLLVKGWFDEIAGDEALPKSPAD